jgi:hypothetical protein
VCGHAGEPGEPTATPGQAPRTLCHEAAARNVCTDRYNPVRESDEPITRGELLFDRSSEPAGEHDPFLAWANAHNPHYGKVGQDYLTCP